MDRTVEEPEKFMFESDTGHRFPPSLPRSDTPLAYQIKDSRMRRIPASRLGPRSVAYFEAEIGGFQSRRRAL
jgi:hypothetical protein